MIGIFVGTNSKYIHTALGLRYVHNFCRERGLTSRLFELTVNEPLLSVLARITSAAEEALEETKSRSAVFFMEVHIWNRDFVFEVAELLRKVMPDALVVLGGPEIMFQPEELLRSCKWADAVVCGEGEEVVADFIERLEKLEAAYPKLSLRKALKIHGEKEEVFPPAVARRVQVADEKDFAVKAPAAPVVISDMDILPFPYPDLEEVKANHKIFYYECTRGCPFHCSYCLSGISHNVRRRSMERVLQDLDRFIAAKVPLVKFVDRTYNLDENYFLPIMEHLAKAETDTVFHFEIKADILSPKVIDFLKTVPQGRFQLEIGVQTTDPKVLKIIGRQDNWKKLAENVSELLAAENMHIHMDLIAGLPSEKLSGFGKSFDDVYALKPDMLQLGFLKVLPGTRMEKEKEKYGLVYMDKPPYETLSTDAISYKELRFLKVLEEVFDFVANSGRFPYTVQYLLKHSGGAFAFFMDFTEEYSRKGLFGMGHKPAEITELLYDYAVKRLSGEEMELLREYLRLDVFVHQPNFRPEFLQWHTEENYDAVSEFWRNEAEVGKYLPGYKFLNWRKVHKRFGIEEFSVNPLTGERTRCFIMAEFGKRKLRIIDFFELFLKKC